MNITTVILWILQILAVPLLSPLVVGLIRRLKAIMQNRHGASPFQPYRDLWKLFHKDEVISKDASFITTYAPYLVFASTLVLGASVPIASLATLSGPVNDILVVVYIMAFGTFFLALTGIDAGGAFGGFGASREMLVSSLAEGGLIVSLFSVALLSRSTNLATMTDAVLSLSPTLYIPVLFAFAAFIIALLAETSRYPFDNPATHLELTMIHEAMIIDLSGKRLALMEWASANKLLVFMLLGANLFLPWGIAVSAVSTSVLVGIVAIIIKVACMGAVIAFIESRIAKLRIFQLPDLLFTSLVLGVIALGLTV